jgi:drug/metabolite transporter (DMT)-like permease
MKPDTATIDIRAVVLLVILCASWGLNQVAIKVAIAGIPPVLQADIRSMGAACLVLVWMRLRKQPLLEKDGTLVWGITAGLLFSVEFVLIYWGLAFTNASRSAIFLNTSPFVVALGAQLFIRAENLTRIQILGMLLAFCGIVVAFHESLNLPDSQMLKGDTMILAAAVLWGATTVVIKAGPLAKVSPGKVLLYQLGTSAVILPPASVLLGEPGIRNLTPLVISSLAYQIIWVAFITYVAWFWLIRAYPVSRLAPFTFLTPLFGVMAGAWLLGESLTLYLVMALIMVGTGIYLVNRK